MLFQYYHAVCETDMSDNRTFHQSVSISISITALRAGVLNIHITVICTELCAALRAGVLNIHITVIFTELCAALRAGVLNRSVLLLFLVYYVLSSIT